eukprot:1129226-Amphidinium_carterae.1
MSNLWTVVMRRRSCLPGWRTGTTWREQWSVVKSAIETAAHEVRDMTFAFCDQAPEVQIMLCLRILQACKQGDWSTALALKNRNSVPGKVVKGIPSIQGITGLILSAKERVLREELAASLSPDIASDSVPKANEWHCRMYGMWRKKRLMAHPIRSHFGSSPPTHRSAND